MGGMQPPGYPGGPPPGYPPGMPPAIANKITMERIIPKHKETLLTIFNKNKISWMSQTDTNNYYLTKTPLKDCSKFHLNQL